MTDRRAAPAAEVIDPQVRMFVQKVSAAYAKYGAFDRLTLEEARRVAEEVRMPWRQGGPVMGSIEEVGVQTGHGTVRTRFYTPGDGNRSVPRPALIYLHGGGWTIFSVDTHDRLMREYAGRSGMTVIGVDYALSPEAKFPVALEQIGAIIQWLRKEGPALGVDPARLALGGDSAGGNLSVATCLRLRDRGESEGLKALLLNYGAFDPSCSEEAERRYGGEGFMLTREEVLQFWRNYLNSTADECNPLACPFLADLRGLPSTFLAIAECDVLGEQNLAMADRLSKAGVNVEAVVYRGATHSFLEAVSVSELANRALDDGSRWLARTLLA